MKKKLLFIIAVAIVGRLILSFGLWHPDLNNHMDWGERFFEYGAAGFYAPEANIWDYTWPNQPPGTILIFAFIRKLFEFVFNIFWQINISVSVFPSGVMTFFEDTLYQSLLKLPSILADLGIAYLIYFFLKKLKKPKAARFGAALFLFNPVIWYNSSVWGQTDSIINFFMLLSFTSILDRKLSLSLLALVLSLYIKISLLIFVPIFVLVALRQKYSLWSLARAIVIPVVAVGIVSALFSDGQNPYSWLFTLYQEKVLTNQLQVITANAFNLWASIAGIHEQPHTLLLGPFSYRHWGYIVFGISFLPMLYMTWRSSKPMNVMWVLALTAFSSWMFLTNMHERYLYPLFPYFTILVANNKKLLPAYLTVSGINLLNLYNFWFTPRIEPIVQFLSLGDRLMPRVLGLLNVGFIGYLYNFYFQKQKSGN